MKVAVETVDSVLRKIEVVLPPERIEELKEEIFRELSRHAKIKGFRQGKVPRPILASFYKEYVDGEVRRRVVETTMADALLEAKVNPIGEPFVDFVAGEGEMGYTIECEVVPDIELPGYKGIEVEVEPVVVTDDDVEKRIDGLRNMHAQMVPKRESEGAVQGDLVFIKYQGYSGGVPLKNVVAESHPLEIGNNTLMPEFESALVGMKPGEEKEVEITFPDDYPDKDIASKPVLFKVTMMEMKEKRMPELNDDFARDVSFDDMVSLREGLRKELEKEKEAARQRTISDRILEILLAGVDIPVPRRLLEKRVELNLEDTKSRFQGQRLSKEDEEAIDAQLRKEYVKREEQKIRIEILLAKIANKEDIPLSDDDVDERIKRIAEGAQRPFEEVKGFYEQNDLMEGLRGNVMREKTLDFLKGEAVIREKA